MKHLALDEYEGLDKLCNVVLPFFNGVSMEDLKSKKRHAHIVAARQTIMSLAARYLKYTLLQIGHYFGGRDHSTVIHARDTVDDQCFTNKDFRWKYERITVEVELHLKSEKNNKWMNSCGSL